MKERLQRRAGWALLVAVALALWLGVIAPRRGAGSDDRVREVIAAVPGAPASQLLPQLTPAQERTRFALVAIAAAVAVAALTWKRRA
jgi:hypothetical protein